MLLLLPRHADAIISLRRHGHATAAAVAERCCRCCHAIIYVERDAAAAFAITLRLPPSLLMPRRRYATLDAAAHDIFAAYFAFTMPCFSLSL